MTAHIGVDADSGLVHSIIGTAANVNDVSQAGRLLHGMSRYPLDSAFVRLDSLLQVLDREGNLTNKAERGKGRARRPNSAPRFAPQVKPR